MGSGSTLLQFDDLTFELIARADFHPTPSDLHRSNQFIAAACIIRSDIGVGIELIARLADDVRFGSITDIEGS
jgi:hypothetical protein